jgi:uncharacterized protein (DUF983 family)
MAPGVGVLRGESALRQTLSALLRYPRAGFRLDTCPKCGARAVVPFLAAKKRCKSCGAYIDIVDLLNRRTVPK